MSSSLPFERLSDSHAILPFDCGDEDINDFFVSQAMHYQKELLAVTYFLEDGENGAPDKPCGENVRMLT